MTTTPLQSVLCQYRYDPLDRSITWMPDRQAGLQRFYCKDRLATEIQNAAQRSIFQHDDQVLAQQHRWGDKVDTSLLATDQQCSVLNAVDSFQTHRIAYTPFGHRPLASGLLSLLGFNGERTDLVTGHYHLGNGYRQFNPVLMRFNSPDKLSPFGKGGVNAYAYCGNNPLNWTDPNGSLRFFGIGKKSISTKNANLTVATMLPEHTIANTLDKKNPLYDEAFDFATSLNKYNKKSRNKLINAIDTSHKNALSESENLLRHTKEQLNTPLTANIEKIESLHNLHRRLNQTVEIIKRSPPCHPHWNKDKFTY